MPKIDVPAVPERKGSGYPAPFHLKAGDRVRQALGDAGGLSEFGVNPASPASGCLVEPASLAQREDEFVYVLSGEVTLITGRRRAGSSRGVNCGVSQKIRRMDNHLDQQDTGPAVPRNRHALNGRRCEYPDLDMRIDARIGHLHAPGRHALIPNASDEPGPFGRK